MLNQTQKEFLIEEINRFTNYHNIEIDMDAAEEAQAIEELSRFSLRRKRAILLEVIIWSLVFLATTLVLFFRKKSFDVGSAFSFAVLLMGSFILLLRAMYALGRNRKFRLIVKMLRLSQQATKHV